MKKKMLKPGLLSRQNDHSIKQFYESQGLFLHEQKSPSLSTRYVCAV